MLLVSVETKLNIPYIASNIISKPAAGKKIISRHISAHKHNFRDPRFGPWTATPALIKVMAKKT